MVALAKTRCSWPGKDPLYVAYHDSEWGVPEHDARTLYEKLVLDGFQAGLSWITILRKRENFRKAFHNFDPHKIARYTARDVDRLLKNDGIIRSRAKIEAISRVCAVIGVRSVAQFVESAAVLQILTDCGVDFAQGFGVARPHSIE